jgi:hypothetical protein
MDQVDGGETAHFVPSPGPHIDPMCSSPPLYDGHDYMFHKRSVHNLRMGIAKISDLVHA